MNIDGLSPGRVFRPQSVEELSQTLSHETATLVPVGGATQQHFGNPLRLFGCAVDLTALNRITEYVAGDLTIHVEAGVRLGELKRILAENSQFLPLDPFNGDDATIGGIAAANAQGAYRATGTIRDWIIGMKVVEVNGDISKTGGRVVKNVTGYDLAKLYTGSIGTLAIIAEISLKVRAKYGRTATAIATLSNLDDVKRLLNQIRTSALQPVSLEWVGPENEVWVRFGEHPHAVEWQLKNLPAADWRILADEEQRQAWDSLSARYARLGPIVLKTIGMPATVVDTVTEFRPAGWIAHAANGIVLMGISDPEVINRIRAKHRAVIERAPLEVRRTYPTFGLNAAEYDLIKKMKLAFDPDCRLNPGRHVDGERSVF